MVWTPIPRSAATTVMRLFRGGPGRVLWKLFVLLFGGLFIYYIGAQSGNWLAVGVLGTIVSIAVSSTIRRILADIWHFRWFKL